MSAIGVYSKRLWRAISVGAFFLFFVGLMSCSPVPGTATPQPTDTPETGVPVTVLDQKGEPFEQGVVIRVSNSAQADDFDNGGLRMGSCDPNTQLIAAWAKGYEVTFGKCNAANILLTPLNARDNIYYSWASAAGNCIACHAGQLDSGYDEINEWLQSGHAKVFDQRYFETIYQGTDLSRNSSPLTQWALAENKLVRLPPVIDPGYHGPGLKLDFPAQPGNCAYCHAPAAVTASQVSVDLSGLFPKPGDVRGEGVTCDVCHKVLDVALDQNGFPFVDRPGILSFEFLRPDNGAFMIGPFANILIPNPNTPINHHLACSPVFSRSEFCAACHYGKFGDIPIYNSYGEWRESDYGKDPQSAGYQTCQDCHMSASHKPITDSLSSERQACTANDTVYRNFDHNVMDLGFEKDTNREIPLMIKGAAKISADFEYDPSNKNWLTVTAKVRSKDVGHRFPTDSPLRHLILFVEVKNQSGAVMTQVDGDRIPNWGGEGNVASEDPNLRFYAGLPGKIFANLLVEEDTNISPTTAYWDEIKYAWVGVLKKDKYDYSDTRLIPGQVDKSKYSFAVPKGGNITVTLRLVYRFAFFDLMRQKGWNRPDVLVTSLECKGLATEPDKIKCKTIE